MITMIIPLSWYNDVKQLVKMENVFYLTEMGRLYVEIDTNEIEFDKISAERGWI